ncbi:lysophospholipid acyltransferase family protein [Amycolatopsis minnesotensis]|uniref:Lysophospholipid acyltransferase family protein n=1 Tax=Amycolatopsis minnesotensis TaxID=337894 RepID=A0ABP5CLV6_9PSEU
MLYRLMKYVLIGPLLRLLWPTKVSGTENIPTTGGAILASNHLAVADSFFMPVRVRRMVTFPAKLEYFTEPGIKGKLKKAFFSGVGQIPIDRSSGSAAQAALDTVIRLLNEGNLVGIYPEGTRSPDGRLYKGKTGVARIALKTGAPVVPVAMIGTDKVNPIGSKMWWPRRLEIRFGAPLDFSRYEGLAGDRFVERSITDEIMYTLMELSGQEYVDIYAAKAKELAAAEAAGVRPAVPAQADARAADRVPESKAG